MKFSLSFRRRLSVVWLLLAVVAQAVAPITVAAFNEHVRHGARLSRAELAAVRRLVDGETHGLSDKAWAELWTKIAANES
jgi:hypothetical protein